MTRLNAINPEQATGKTKELFKNINGKLGMVPNMMRTMGNSPSFLEAYLNLSGTLTSGSLGAKIGELIALAVAESNACNYCLSAHSFIGGQLMKMDASALEEARLGNSRDNKTDAILKFAVVLLEKRGHVNDTDVNNIKAAGVTEGEIGEIVGQVALNVMTNYFNNTANTVIDFPIVEAYQTIEV